MVDYNTKNALGSLALDYSVFVPGTYYETAEVLLDEATAGYTPANGDVLCRKSDDTNKHQKYDHTDAALVILGVVCEIKQDNTGTPVVKLSYATDAAVYYAGIGYTGTQNAAQKLAFKDLLRLKNINLVD